MWRYLRKPGLLLLSVLLLTLAYAPIHQFYFAWVGLIPWLMVIRQTRRLRGAFFWGWLGGSLFFAANMWWLAFVSGPGVVALISALGLYWGLLAWVIRGTGLLGTSGETKPIALVCALLIAAVWAAFEWVRSWLFTGLPWLFIGHTQSPFLPMCQVADLFGVYGISFWVVMLNAILAMAIFARASFSRIRLSLIGAAAMLITFCGYGIWRLEQTDSLLKPGPTIMVVQSNYPQSNNGDKGAKMDDILGFHLKETEKGLTQRGPIGLVVWSETMIPPINEESREFLVGHDDTFPLLAYREISDLARSWQTPIVVGADCDTGWKMTRVKRGRTGYTFPAATDKRNSAYLFEADGTLSPLRYDKIHLVPFGEYTPFKQSFPPIYHFFLWFNPYPDPEANDLVAGAPDALTVFRMPAENGQPAFRYVTPICFEDIDAALVARMFRSPTGQGKRADVLVNLTNDGWFRANQMSQHLQVAVFRSIENRVPTARSVNTGVSGFVDSVGHVLNTVPAQTSGVATEILKLDPRVTFYTRFGDVFVWLCAAITGILIASGIYQFFRDRVRQRKMQHEPQG